MVMLLAILAILVFMYSTSSLPAPITLVILISIFAETINKNDYGKEN